MKLAEVITVCIVVLVLFGAIFVTIDRAAVRAHEARMAEIARGCVHVPDIRRVVCPTP